MFLLCLIFIQFQETSGKKVLGRMLKNSELADCVQDILFISIFIKGLVVYFSNLEK